LIIFGHTNADIEKSFDLYLKKLKFDQKSQLRMRLNGSISTRRPRALKYAKAC